MRQLYKWTSIKIALAYYDTLLFAYADERAVLKAIQLAVILPHASALTLFFLLTNTMTRRSVTSEDEDPLTLAIAPPPNETPTQRDQRLAEEKKAKEISDSIDEEINVQRLAEKKENPVKVLLLGMLSDVISYLSGLG